MAEIAVGFVLHHLSPLLSQEASLLRSVHSEVSDIKRELQSIQCFLRDADGRAEAEGDTNRGDGVKMWVDQVREVAFQIEDVVDEYFFHFPQTPSGHGGGFVSFLHKFGHSIIKLKVSHGIASQIRCIKATILEIKERCARYGFDSLNYDQQGGSINLVPQRPRWYDPRKESVFMEEAEVVGIELDRDNLVGWLTNISPRRIVVSVVGMGGLGKTTLAKLVYDQVITKFDCHAWITASESYDRRELLKKIMDKFCIPTTASNLQATTDEIDDEIQMISKIREFLKDKRYVVFFDDVWRVEFWGDIEHALFDNKKGGRIMITTRSVDVALFCKISSYVYVHMLQPLPPLKAWQLFCNKAFQFQFRRSCPPELENYSRKIVQRCKGLPLAIVAIAGLLSTKEKTIDEWQKLHDNLSYELESNLHLASITRILLLSYNDLPYHLKSCFLYLGIYPPDYSISCARLIRQWVAEGFIIPKKDKSLEVVAHEYLAELKNRCLVQVSRVSYDGKAKECCIHDLQHEIVRRKMRELSFGHHFSQHEYGFGGVTRRLSIDTCPDVVVEKLINDSHVRGIHFFNTLSWSFDWGNTKFCDKFKLLKVLDFEGVRFLSSLPNDIGNLFHLKYLSLAYTSVDVLPRSIRKLQNLETLDLKYSSVYELSFDVKGLHKLRHLFTIKIRDSVFGNALNKGVQVKKGFGYLTALQKLCYVELEEKVRDEQIAELRKLTQLRKFGILNLRIRDGESLCKCINEMKHLESLRVSAKGYAILDLDSLSSPPEFLRSLLLTGYLKKLHEWITSLQNLAKLEISLSSLEDDPISVFQNLPNLVVLKMSEFSYEGEQLHFKQGVFPKLKYLFLQHLTQLKSLVIKGGAMPTLLHLSIDCCNRLEKVPSGILHLRNLEKLSFLRMPFEFLKSIRPDGLHYHIVRHVPVVFSKELQNEELKKKNGLINYHQRSYITHRDNRER